MAHAQSPRTRAWFIKVVPIPEAVLQRTPECKAMGTGCPREGLKGEGLWEGMEKRPPGIS